MSIFTRVIDNGDDSSEVRSLYRERALYADRAADAEDKGFFRTAKDAREKVQDIERRIAAAQAHKR